MVIFLCILNLKLCVYHFRLLAGLQVLQAIVEHAFHVGQWCIVKHNQNVVVQLLLYVPYVCNTLYIHVSLAIRFNDCTDHIGYEVLLVVHRQ